VGTPAPSAECNSRLRQKRAAAPRQNAVLTGLLQAQQQNGLLTALQEQQLLALQQQQISLLSALRQQSSTVTQLLAVQQE
jgi:hypothetical protein